MAEKAVKTEEALQKLQCEARATLQNLRSVGPSVLSREARVLDRPVFDRVCSLLRFVSSGIRFLLPLPHPFQSTQRPIRLSDLPIGRLARLHTTAIAPQDCALLGALGMTDRCLLSVCKMGEPCIVRVHATRIGISRSVADGIMVVPEAVE